MFRLLIVIFILFRLNAHAQYIACKDDDQCIMGYYCQINTHLCRECLCCQDFGRKSPKSSNLTDCIKIADECGSCFEGLVKDYKGVIKSKCVQPENETLKYFTNFSLHIYLSYTAAFIGCILIVIFVYVYRTTKIFKLVAYTDSYIPAATTEHKERNTVAVTITV